jgi:hypothetical protein
MYSVGDRLPWPSPIAKAQQQPSREGGDGNDAPGSDNDAAEVTKASESKDTDRPAQTTERHERAMALASGSSPTGRCGPALLLLPRANTKRLLRR